MKPHPSLSAPFIEPEPIYPQESMSPYLECWCGSQKKWKWCHKDRQKQKEQPVGRLIAEMRAELQVGYCSHPNASLVNCSNKIIRSHTIQRRGGLADIAEDGHVISVKAGIDGIFENNGKINPKLVGVKSASTFNGFCETHDTQMFRPVEAGTPSLNFENAFLLTFRAISYELFTKRAALRAIPIQQQMDFGKPYHTQAAIQSHLHYTKEGMIRGISDMEKWKAQYDSAYNSKDFSSFSFYAAEFTEVLPVAASGAFHPEFDFQGNHLQIITRGTADFDHIAFNLTTLNGASVAVFGWIGGADSPASQFARSFHKMPDQDKSSAAIQLAFEQLENTCIRPSWWSALPEQQKFFAMEKFHAGLGISGPERTSKNFSERPWSFSNATISNFLGE
jgi:hypothetical protein